MKFKDMTFFVYTNGSRKQHTFEHLRSLDAHAFLINGSGESVYEGLEGYEVMLPDKSVLGAHRNIYNQARLAGLDYIWVAEDGLRKILIQDDMTFLWRKVADMPKEVIQKALEEEFDKFLSFGLDYMSLCLRVGIRRDRIGELEFHEGKLKKLGTTFTLWKVDALGALIEKIDEVSGGKEFSHGLDIIFASAAATLGLQNGVDFRLGVDEIPGSTLRDNDNDVALRTQDIKNLTTMFPNVDLSFSWSKAQPHTAILEDEDVSDRNIKEFRRNISLIKNEEYKARMEKAFTEVFGEEY